MRTFSALLGCSRKLTRLQRTACDEPGNTLAAYSRIPTHTLNTPDQDQTLSRFDTPRNLGEGAINEREKESRGSNQQQPRRARRIQYLATQHSIGDRSLQHALFAINRAPRGVISVTTLAVPFDNSVLRVHVLIPQSPPPTSALRFCLQSRFKRGRLICDPTICRSSALHGHAAKLNLEE